MRLYIPDDLLQVFRSITYNLFCSFSLASTKKQKQKRRNFSGKHSEIYFVCTEKRFFFKKKSLWIYWPSTSIASLEWKFTRVEINRHVLLCEKKNSFKERVHQLVIMLVKRYFHSEFVWIFIVSENDW